MKLKNLKHNKTFSMKINLAMRSILKYSICSIFLLNFIHCTNVDDPVSLFEAPIEGEGNEPLANVSNSVFQSNLNGITLTWTNPTGADFSKVLILKNTSPISDAPTTGHYYVGVDLIGSSQMMYNAALSSFTDTDITAGITYFYKLFAYDVSFNYASGVQLKVDILAPSVTIPASSLIVAEGAAETYMISLAINGLPPSGENVVINLSTNHALLIVNPSQLTLDSSNPSKIVTVTRVNNDIDESDNLMGMVSHSLDSSTGASYNIDSVRDTVDNTNITVFMSDDDTAGFVFTPANREVNVTEGGMENYTVKLSSKPTGDVTLNVNLATGLSGSVPSLTFTPLNWNAIQTVSITAEDNEYAGGYTAQVNHGVSSTDSKYNSIDPDRVSVSVNVVDDDGGTGSIVISANTLAFDDTDGATGATYTISLSHYPAPGKTVQVSLRSGNSALEVNPTVVNFDGTTRRSPQTITVRRAGGASGMIMADISVAISHTIATGVSYDPNIITFANSSGDTVNVTIDSTALVVDSDHDGLIDIDTAIKLNNMRHDLAGTSYKISATQTTGNSKGCPPVVNGIGGCHGYELTVNIDLLNLLDKNGNGTIEKMMVGVDKNADGDTDDTGEKVTVIDIGTGKDKSWAPVSAFTGTFEGNNHTIANLWVNVNSRSAGLFGSTSGTAEIRNVGVISGSIHSSYSSGTSSSGGLVGSGTVTITNSYFSGSGGVSSSSSSFSSRSGGLVGSGGSSGTVSIMNSYFSGMSGVSSSSSSSESYSGGLMGSGSIVSIMNSYFSGSGGVSSSSSSSSSSRSGGLVGYSSSALTIVNSYFSGMSGVSSSSSSSSSRSGGLVGSGRTVSIMNSYFSGAGGVSSSSSSSYSRSGGLVGYSSSALTIVNSYFSGAGGVSSSYYSGGLVGFGRTMTITNGYWNNGAPQSVDGGTTNQSPKRAQGNAALDAQGDLVDVPGTIGLTLTQLKAITSSTPSAPSPSDLPHSATDNTNAWDLGTISQLPAVKLCVSPTVSRTNVVTCASYGALIKGQR